MYGLLSLSLSLSLCFSLCSSRCLFVSDWSIPRPLQSKVKQVAVHAVASPKLFSSLCHNNHRATPAFRWLSKDYSSSWSRDPLLDMNRPPEIGGGGTGDHGAGGAKKGSGWVSTRSSGFPGGTASGGGRRSYGGGSSSSATGGGW